MVKKVLIIGNGLDLGFGLKTSYSDFSKSNEWKDLYKGVSRWRDNLANALRREASKKNWFDVENCILEYAERKSREKSIGYVDDDRRFFESLKRKLNQYLWKPAIETIADEGIAIHFCKTFFDNRCFDEVYTFNYTPLDFLLVNSDCDIDVPNHIATHLHNMLDDNIILGINEDADVLPEYDFLKKVNNMNYHGTNIIRDLREANEIVIYGHSLNKIDFGYFKDLFLNSTQNSRHGERHITIITKDRESAEQIKSNLQHNGADLTVLISVDRLEFIMVEQMTDSRFDSEKMKYEALLSRLIHH